MINYWWKQIAKDSSVSIKIKMFVYFKVFKYEIDVYIWTKQI